MKANLLKKNLNYSPDDVLQFPKGKAELVATGGIIIGRVTLAPGWKWSESLKPIEKTDHCEKQHIRYHISGRLRVRMDDGTECEFGPGDAAAVPPGHDEWVVGDEPAIIMVIAGATPYRGVTCAHFLRGQAYRLMGRM